MAAGCSCPSESASDGELKEDEEGAVQDEEWFEIADFSTVTAWERLAAQLEHLLRQTGTAAFEAPASELAWGGHQYELLQFQNSDQTHSQSSPTALHLSRCFDLPQLLLLRPVTNQEDKSLAAMWLGALVCACGCAKVDLPCFVEQGPPPHHHCMGYSCTGQHSTRYSVEHLPCPSAECNTLHGLHRLFSRLLGGAGGLHSQFVATAQHSHSIAGYAAEDWQEVTCPLGSVPACSLSMNWGTTADPVDRLHCLLTWPALPDGALKTASDQLHCIGPVVVSIQSSTREVGVLLGDQVREFLDVVLEHQYRQQGVSDRDFRPDMFLSRRKQCDVLVSTGRDAGALVLKMGAILATHQTELLSEEQALEYVRAIFSPSLQCLPPDVPPALATPTMSLYAPDSMPALLAYQAAQVVSLQHRSAADSVAAVLRLWRRFTEAVRLFWEAGETLLPHVHPGPPDWGSCLLHQKLQMVNVCISQQRAAIPVTPLTSGTDGWDLDLGDEENEADASSPSKSPSTRGSMECGTSLPPAPETAPCEGRLGALRPLGDAALLRSGRVLYIPVTQQPLPVTEDMVGQQQEVFSRLGTSKEAHRLRTRLQTGSLQSDMQAFKAANPFDPCLADFVRWYSPKDFSAAKLAEFDSQHGLGTGHPAGPHAARELHCLSRRMQDPGNVWQTLWEEAAALPVSEQRQGFDAVREANVALHHLEQLPVPEVLKCLADHWAVMTFAAVANAPITTAVPHVRTHVQRIAEALTASLVPNGPLGLERYTEVCDMIDVAEASCAAAVSLLARFGCPPTSTPTAPLADLVSRMLDAQGSGPVVASDEEWRAMRDVVASHPVEEWEYRLRTEDGLQRLCASHSAAGSVLATALSF
eukprot:GGOE01006087.1.p1 GENE.GGOE01006087.1~~GGOE01006087.1.p1  ORF type:complete len:869 (-),score=208.30 GGOE01006087.1:213-2819(-)